MNSPVIEPLYTAKELSEACGGTQSEESILAAMNRKGAENNPLPNIASGNKRPIRRTTIGCFLEWRAREMERSVNA